MALPDLRNTVDPIQRLIGTQATCGDGPATWARLCYSCPRTWRITSFGTRQGSAAWKPRSSGTASVIRTKSVYSPIDRRRDGLRVLVTRFRGRGLPKNRYDMDAESRPERGIVARWPVRACNLALNWLRDATKKWKSPC